MRGGDARGGAGVGGEKAVDQAVGASEGRDDDTGRRGGEKVADQVVRGGEAAELYVGEGGGGGTFDRASKRGA